MCAKFPNKEYILRVLFFVFKKAMVFLSKNDGEFRKIAEKLEDGFSFAITVKNSNFKVAMIKNGNTFEPLSLNKTPKLFLIFNNICSAFLVFGGFMPQHTAFSEHRIAIKGNISDAIVITAAINRLQSVIFPDVISKSLIKDFKGSTTKERALFAKFYTYGLIL